MSVSDAQEFLRQLASDPALAKEEAAAHRRMLVDLAHTKGFEVSEQDLANAMRAAREAPYGPVDDAALEAVVGATNATVAVHLPGNLVGLHD